MTVSSAETGPEKRSDRTKMAILQAARERLAAHGYDRTTIRAVAADAGIDPSMVMRYFGNKAQLFDAAMDIDLRLPDLSAVPPEELPDTLIRVFLERWEHDPAGDALLMLLRSAVTNEHAAAQMRRVFAAQVAPALTSAVGADVAPEQVGLIAAQLLGLALTRYLLLLPAVATLTPEQTVVALAPAIRATLDRPSLDSSRRIVKSAHRRAREPSRPS